MATLNEYRAFVSGVPEASREYRTIELYHSQLDRVYRFVRNSVDVTMTIELNAPRDAGQPALFAGSTIEITEPAEREDSEQILSVSFGNVDGTVHHINDQISGAGFFEQVQLVYRKYYSGNLAVPAVPPLYLSVSSLNFNGPAVTFSAEDADLSQKRSGAVYNTEQFPGLAQ